MIGKRIIKDVGNGSFLLLSMTFKIKKEKKKGRKEKSGQLMT